MTKSGLVLEVKRDYVTIMSAQGEFLHLKIRGKKPAIGEEYSGELIVKSSPMKYIAAAAVLFMLLLSGSTAYAYYTPTQHVILEVNPSLSIGTNRFNKIVEVKALNPDGEKLLEKVDVKYKTLGDGLTSLIKECETDHIIDSSKEHTINLIVQNEKTLKDIAPLEQYISNTAYTLKVEERGEVRVVKPKRETKNTIEKDNPAAIPENNSKKTNQGKASSKEEKSKDKEEPKEEKKADNKDTFSKDNGSSSSSNKEKEKENPSKRNDKNTKQELSPIIKNKKN